MPNLNLIDLLVVVAYLVGVTALGCMMTRKTRTANEFMAAGGTLPGWVVGLSIIGTFVSSISFIANPGKSYADNWNPFVFSLSLPLAAWIATKFFVPWFRDGGSMSAYEHLEVRFGTWARLYAATFNVLYHIGRIGTILFGVSLAVAALIDVPVLAIIIALGVLVIVYTLLGGIEAVIWTDVLQSVILIGGMLICGGLLIANTPGGFRGIISAAGEASGNKLSLGSTTLDFSTTSIWMMLLFGIFINVQNFAADQTFVQRYFTAKSEADARRSVWLGALAFIPLSAVLFFIGTALFVFYQAHGSLPEGTESDRVLPYFIMHELPTGLSGLLIAAILAAAMSTVDSSLNSSATLLLCDVRRRFFGGPVSDSSELIFLRVATVVLGILGVGAAIFMMGNKSLLDAWWKLSGVMSGGTLGLILLTRFTKIQGWQATLPATLIGVTAIAVVTLADTQQPPAMLKSVCAALHPLRGYLHPLMAIVVGTISVFVFAVLFNLAFNAKQRTE
jgi:SSS family solute:Na+ symporter